MGHHSLIYRESERHLVHRTEQVWYTENFCSQCKSAEACLFGNLHCNVLNKIINSDVLDNCSFAAQLQIGVAYRTRMHMEMQMFSDWLHEYREGRLCRWPCPQSHICPPSLPLLLMCWATENFWRLLHAPNNCLGLTEQTENLQKSKGWAPFQPGRPRSFITSFCACKKCMKGLLTEGGPHLSNLLPKQETPSSANTYP